MYFLLHMLDGVLMPNVRPQVTSSPMQAAPIVGELLMPDGGDAESRVATERLVKVLSLWMDSVFRIPGVGWRFGLDPIIGLLPIAGDLASAGVSIYILLAAGRLQVPRITIARMGLNVAIDYTLGAIPLIGNVFDFVWKANARNVEILERTLAARPDERRRQSLWDWLFILTVVFSLVALLIGTLVAATLLAAWIVNWARTVF
jgi:Domain of unknown function (DUF4112)